MVYYQPPLAWTVRAAGRLRIAAALACLSALFPVAAAAKPAPVRVLVGAPVATAARSSMSPALWSKIIANYVNAEVVPFEGIPTLDDCRRRQAEYMVAAPFELRPRLPGMMNSTGRTMAVTRLVVTNCVTSTQVFEQTINLESDPPSNANAGDYDSVPEISWSRSVPAALAKYPVFFPRVARVLSVTPPLAVVDIAANLRPGDTLRVFADAKHNPKGPIILTVTQVTGKTAEVLFSIVGGAIAPSVGDLVEPMTVPPPAK